MKTYLTRLIYLFLVIQAVNANAQTSFQVESSRLFFYESTNGVAPSTLLKVKNPGSSHLTIRASCADWRRDSVGDKIYGEPGTMATSCCSYLTVNPETVDLNPGEERELLITVNPGKQPQKMLNGMLMLTQLNEEEWQSKSKAKAQIMFRMRIGVHVYYIPKQLNKRSVSIDTMIVKKDAKEAKPIQLRIQNTGDLNLDSHVRFELTNLQTSQEFTVESMPVNTMPTEKIWLSSPLPEKLPKGRYLVVAIVDSGPETAMEVAELETDFN